MHETIHSKWKGDQDEPPERQTLYNGNKLKMAETRVIYIKHANMRRTKLSW